MKVSRLKTKLPIENNINLPIYTIPVSPETDTKQLYKIKYLNNMVISWETLNKKNNYAMQKMPEIRARSAQL